MEEEGVDKSEDETGRRGLEISAKVTRENVLQESGDHGE
jgi:hypothetical protein